ncbi:hypothetical protein CO174_01615 [Candidatus Uhrbacteria bacterium CG_4_9_14_3_um_filter_50_9]|uniref:DNA/pantothenate metabolism flavoprotein C-terminal domain-containing protein n=1 Tax=Candidatus Uhrbacteria bacterium CG_4_9_14_3_um_filter_50_9 TaxID=1975035 RepID=A0A2M7XD79_9BACT|nr:MAG: hypothetical protein CO174_01615 [Candidatus Uhrbacteria bacterium CG_4_9_14_3_um_filter_50_9]
MLIVNLKEEGNMRILITAGSTMSMIDNVRGITNVFTGRTGAGYAVENMFGKAAFQWVTLT